MEIDGGLGGLFRASLKSVDFQRIETGGTGRGIPDTNFCVRGGVEGWVEYKITDGWTPSVLPEQVGWILRRVRFGGRVFFAVRRVHDGGPRKGPAVDELWLVRGAAARELKRGGLREIPSSALVGHWTGGPSRWDWPAVLRVLTSPTR